MRSSRSCRAHPIFKTLASAGLLAAGLMLAGCETDGAPVAESARGSAVAFEQIDGLPRTTFDQLVESLGPAAEAHKVATVSRQADAPYRVKGYLSLEKQGAKTSLAYAWDVFDRDGSRVARLTGSEPLTVPRGTSDPWTVCNEQVLAKVADRTMADLSETLSGGQPGAVAAAAGVPPEGKVQAPPVGAAARSAFLQMAPPPTTSSTLAYTAR